MVFSICTSLFTVVDLMKFFLMINKAYEVCFLCSWHFCKCTYNEKKLPRAKSTPEPKVICNWALFLIHTSEEISCYQLFSWVFWKPDSLGIVTSDRIGFLSEWISIPTSLVGFLQFRKLDWVRLLLNLDYRLQLATLLQDISDPTNITTQPITLGRRPDGIFYFTLDFGAFFTGFWQIWFYA